MRLVLSLALIAGSLSLAACGDDSTTDLDGSVVEDGRVSTDTGGGTDATSSDASLDAGGADSGRDAGRDGGRADSAVARSMVFFHTNDEHSHELGFAPELDDFPTPAPAGSGIVGGVKRRAKVLEDLRADANLRGSPVAVVSAGDQMMGSLFHLANPSRGLDYAVAALLQYDAMTIGNHELDFGVSALSGALRNGGLGPGGNPALVTIPIVASNIRFSMTSNQDDSLAALYSVRGDMNHPVRRTLVKRFGDVTVGFIGLMGLDASLVAPFKAPLRFSLATNNATCTRDTDCPGSVCVPPAENPLSTMGRCALNTDESDVASHFPALVADAAAAVAALRAQNVDLVVALSHVGVDERELATLEAMMMGPENAQSSEEILLALGVDQALAGMRGIDVIIGGHSHTKLEEPIVVPNTRAGMNTYVVQAGSYGRYVGKLRLTQASPAANWELDADYSGLEPVDDTVDVSTLNAFTAMLIDSAVGQVIGGMEALGAAVANDALIYPGEQCDGTELPNNGLCAGVVPGAVGGMLRCHPNRQLDLSMCDFGSGSCGNNTIEGSEQCEGANLRAQTCVSLGYEGGNLGCGTTCGFDTSGCAVDYPSLLEIVLNFGQTGPVIRDDPQVVGDLFFYILGMTTFDVPDKPASNEGNLINLVTDAARVMPNRLVPRLQTDPIRLTIEANGVLRDGIAEGRTGRLALEDIFRVLPLGVSPVETTPTFPLVDFWLLPEEIIAALEVGVSRGLDFGSFWLGVSGARVEYDLSRPVFDRNTPGTGRITRVVLTNPMAEPWDDSASALEATPLFDRSLGANPFPDPNRLVHVATNLYVSLFLDGLGLCPRDAQGMELVQCRTCTMPSQCTAASSTCDMESGRCRGPVPAVFNRRTVLPDTFQEFKEVLALITYIRSLPNNGTLPGAYNGPVPRRLCCVGTACPADGSRTCN
jgi:2',3'-cyclic-nucleotide 2'-phosphodiesterase (5'-nucleotidase family)